MEFNRLDVSTKELIWDEPAMWLDRYAVGPPGPVEVIDSEITTMTASADKVLKVGGEQPYLVVLEPHSYHDSNLVRTLWYRQVALDHRHGLPVLTILILLRKEANSPSLNGTYERHLPDGTLTNRYNYRVVRLWEEDPESYLAAGVNLVPLVPLTGVPETEEALRGLMHRMAERIDAEPKPRADKLWMAAYFLTGLRYPNEIVSRVMEGVQNVRGSSTYQAVLDEGREDGRISEARRMLLMLGGDRFGEPNEAIRGVLAGIHDVERLERMSRRVYAADIQDWEGLLLTP
jgi:hypothetical protein